MPKKSISEQPSFEDVAIQDVGLPEEGVADVVEAVLALQENRAAHQEYQSAERLVKKAIPAYEKPTRVRINDLAVVEVTPSSRKPYKVEASSGHRRTIKLAGDQ